MTECDLSKLVWRRSSACDDSQCIEVALADKVVLVRDSKDKWGKILAFSYPEWRAFTSGMRDNKSVSACRRPVTDGNDLVDLGGSE